MATSFSHKFGQVIGDLLEVAIKPLLDSFARQHHLFLDVKGNRLVRGKGRKLTWTDLEGNKHDLDFVLERHGTESIQGTPVACLDAAWRRSPKHSRNKAQEIQGAILPLTRKYAHAHPFTGVVLAGDFTADALTQLRSSGFHVLYFPYQTVLAAFRAVGIEAGFDEQTAEADFEAKVAAFYALPDPAAVARQLVELNRAEVAAFLTALEASVSRRIAQVHVLPLHGNSHWLPTVAEAVNFIADYREEGSSLAFSRYEIIIRFSTGSEVIGKLFSRAEALDFLETYS